MTSLNISTKDDVEEKSITLLKNLCEKYETNSYILQRIDYYMNTFLQSTLETEQKNYEKRQDRTLALTKEQNVFIQVFLSKNQYYYLSQSNCFYEYKGLHYNVVKEDDIIHNLLSTISKDRVLMPWKYKTKLLILKKIKERCLLKSVPDSSTIQSVLGFLVPSVFSTKNKAKYFLTLIGDNIFKKNSDLIFLINSTTKKILTEIDNSAYVSIGNSNTLHNFMTKFHENHAFDKCRLLSINENISVTTVKDYLSKYCLDLLCVAAHYSLRYDTSDNFLKKSADHDLKNYTLFLKNNDQHKVVELFCKECIESASSNNYSISWKHIHYIWKQYIFDLHLPNMIYSNTFKYLLKSKFLYDETTDSFLNITSKYLPAIKQFRTFWEQNVQYITSDGFDEELELDEICSLYKDWSSNNDTITEDNVLNILRHYYPDVEIMEDKYVLNVSTKLFGKQTDIIIALEKMKTELNKCESIISFDDAYSYYCQFISSDSESKILVSKRYFEKFIIFYLGDFVVFDNFISGDWVKC